jgi:hypothetical protein
MDGMNRSDWVAENDDSVKEANSTHESGKTSTTNQRSNAA